MSRPRGGYIIGTLPTWTVTDTSGIFTLREAQAMRTTNQWPVGQQTVTLFSGGGNNSWRWQSDGYFTYGVDGSQFYVGKNFPGENQTSLSGGWRTTWSPSAKPQSIISAVFSVATGGDGLVGGAFSITLKGANLDNAAQGLQGSSQTTASGSATAPASGNLTITCTSVIAEIIGRQGWVPGNSIVLYLLNGNAGANQYWSSGGDTAGSLEITYT